MALVYSGGHAARQAGTGNAYRLLRFRVNTLSELIFVSEHWPEFIRYTLHVHLDRHIAYVLEVETDSVHGPSPQSSWTQCIRVVCEDNMPDMSAFLMHVISPCKQVSTSICRDTRRTTKRLSAQELYGNACIHILSKCMPKSCLMRNMPDAVMKKCEQSPVFEHAVVDIIQCAVCGNFKHCSSRLSFYERKAVMRDVALFMTPPNNTLSNILKANKSDMTVYYCIRDYITAFVRYNTALHASFYDTLVWDQVEYGSHYCMNKIRTLVTNQFHVSRGKTFYETLFLSEESLEVVRKVSKKVPRQLSGTAKEPFVKFISTCVRRGEVDPVMFGKCAALVQSLPPNMRLRPRWIVRCGLDTEGVEQIVDAATKWSVGAASEAKEIFVNMKPSNKSRCHAFSLVYKFMQSILYVRLPEAITKQQLVAIRNRFPEVTEDIAIQRASDLWICVACKNIKNFIPGIATTTKDRKTVTRAHGYRRVTHGNDCICCAGKSKMCEKVPVLRLRTMWPDIGISALLQIDNHVVLVSPCCGMLRTFDSLVYDEDGWLCSACAENKKKALAKVTEPPARVCDYCSKHIRPRDVANVYMFKKATGEVQPVILCVRHSKKWMVTKKPLHKDFVFANMYKNEVYDV